MKKLNAILFAVLLAVCLRANGQSSPPMPPGFKQPPLRIIFGGPPVIGIAENQIYNHVSNFKLPDNYVVQTILTNIPAAVWNEKVGARLKLIRVDIDGVSSNTVKRLGDTLVPEPLRVQVISAYYDIGWVEQAEAAANGELEMVWVGEAGFQHYLQLAKNHGQPADQWKIKYVNNRAWYALDRKRLDNARTWNTQP